jgi:hypothetical protein
MFCSLHVRGVQLGAPHFPGTPPPPQVSGAVQSPHASTPPQPSPAGPHSMFCSAHVRGLHDPPQTPGTPPPPQTCPGGHVPQEAMRLPQPSPAGPHAMPSCAQVFGMQPPPSGMPHWFGTPPPPQVCGHTQLPHTAVMPPQPSLWAPHEFG